HGREAERHRNRRPTFAGRPDSHPWAGAPRLLHAGHGHANIGIWFAVTEHLDAPSPASSQGIPMHVKKASGTAGRIARFARRIAVLVIGLGMLAPATAASLDPQLLPRIQAVTFEVVAAKPVDDAIRYEKPLPLDLLPYQQRTDKYYSIGTAFYMGDGRYISAGHVLMTGIGSLWGPPELRDAAGHVYPIDKIKKFSLGQ